MLRKTYGRVYRNESVTSVGTGDFEMLWDTLGEVGRVLVEDYVLKRIMRIRNHSWIW